MNLKGAFAIFLLIFSFFSVRPIPASAQSSFGGGLVAATGTAAISCINITGAISSLFSSLRNKVSMEVSVADNKNNSKESCGDAIAFSLSKLALQKVTESTLNWVNSGFSGNPFYVQDPSSYFKSIESEQVGQYLRVLPQKNPLFGEIIRNTILGQFTGKATPAASLPNNILGNQFKNYNEDFRSGGWDMWFASLEDNYNPVGAYFGASNELGSNIDRTITEVKDELNQGSGFLSQKKCVEYAAPTTATNTLGGATGLSVTCTSPGNCTTTANPYAANADANQQRQCIRWQTVTPGSIIAEQLKMTTTSVIRQTELADEVNESLASIFNAIINQLFNKGLTALRSRSSSGGTFDFGGPGANVIYDSSGNIIGLDQDSLYRNSADNVFNNAQFNIRNPQHLRAALKTQYDFLNASTDSSLVLERIPANLGSLDYCIPGPHTGWEGEVNQGYSSIQSAFSQMDMSNAGFFAGSNSDLVFPAYALVDATINEQRLLPGFEFEASTIGSREQARQMLAQNWTSWLQQYMDFINTTFTKERILSAFAATGAAADQGYIRGMMTDAMREAQNLNSYSSSIIDIQDEYSQAKRQTEMNIAELEDIKREVIQIVTTARNRHIAQMAAAGTPVNMACLNTAYDVTDTPLVGQARREMDAQDQIVNYSAAAGTVFYSNL